MLRRARKAWGGWDRGLMGWWVHTHTHVRICQLIIFYLCTPHEHIQAIVRRSLSQSLSLTLAHLAVPPREVEVVHVHPGKARRGALQPQQEAWGTHTQGMDGWVDGWRSVSITIIKQAGRQAGTNPFWGVSSNHPTIPHNATPRHVHRSLIQPHPHHPPRTYPASRPRRWRSAR